MNPRLRSKLDSLVGRLGDLNSLLAAENATKDMEQFKRLSREHAEVSDERLEAGAKAGRGDHVVELVTRAVDEHRGVCVEVCQGCDDSDTSGADGVGQSHVDDRDHPPPQELTVGPRGRR